MGRLPIGTPVRIKNGLVPKSRYGGLYFAPEMTEFIGEVAVIDRIYDNYILFGSLIEQWEWNDHMVNPLSEEEIQEFSFYSLEYGYPISVERKDGKWLHNGKILNNPKSILVGNKGKAKLSCDIYKVGKKGGFVDVIINKHKIYLEEKYLPMCGSLSDFSEIIKEEF